MWTWNTILTKDQIEADLALTAKLDPHHAAESRKFWESQSAIRLSCLASGAWQANDRDTYVKARSYLARMGG